MDDKAAIEFQIYSSHNVTRRHLVGMSSIYLSNLCELENGLADLTIMPETVYRVSYITNTSNMQLKFSFKMVSFFNIDEILMSCA